MITAWSYSRYATYKQCPFKFKLKFIDRLPEPGSPAMDRGNTIHKLAEDFTLGKIKKLPPELTHFKGQFNELKKLKPFVEQEWGFKRDWSHTGRSGWFGDDVWFRAKCDLGLVYTDNTAEIIDHKTGKKYETNKEQVELFALAGFKRFPEVTEITTRLWYLDQPTDNEVIETYTAADAARIAKDWEKRVIPMFADRKYPPLPNDKCRWCHFRKANGGPCKF